MTKIEDDIRGRLREAGLELFREHGFERTTAAQIAARAGVTERTFFRHFPDKREVLFGGEAMVRAALVAAINDAPDKIGALETLFWAFHSLQPMLEATRSYAKPRHEIISTTLALRERELTKLSALGDALAIALVARGIAELPAILAARTGLAAYEHAIVAWLDDPDMDLGKRMELTFGELKVLLASTGES